MPLGTAAIVAAAGSGSRVGATGIPKQYQAIGGKPVLVRALDAFLAHPGVDRVLPVIAASEESRYAALGCRHDKLLPAVHGGPTRQESVLAALTTLSADPPQRVLIHDAARPFLTSALIDRVIGGLDRQIAVVPALPVTDTLKRVERGQVLATVLREGMWAVETPQGFAFDAILAAHRRAADQGRYATDDAALVEWMGQPVAVVPGEPDNVKLTTAEDLAAARRRFELEAALRFGDVRVGVGIDVHAFGPGKQVILGGVAIPHTRELTGHSDADVVLHALTDAVLGALADGDIGVHFPPSDPQWKGTSSDRFLSAAAERVRARQGMIAHLDVAIIAEAPRIAPYREKMRARIAAICGIAVDRVSVKAGTNEGLGFVGRGEGIAAYATATIRLPLTSPPASP
jgi:2-C-methyl-D-erythritol 4-phosphate cytidylyltransferase/2-C-methyl-D-erythritol 2,4-cyclodiphosphate synthase